MVNKEYDTRLCIIMVISLIIGTILVLVAKEAEICLYLYIISEVISFFMLYFLPKKLYNRFDEGKLKKMKHETITLLFIIMFGPITTIFIIMSTFKKKKGQLEKSNAVI